MDDRSQQKYVPSKSEMRKVVIASLLGATIEWYDFFLYGVVAGIVFNKLYFPTTDPFMGTILAYSTFAIGYLARPFGGFLFGHYGDKLGRKRMLILTMLIMGIATVGIGLVPTYASIGIAAPIILQTLRLCQGLGLGGEWGGAVLMTYEYASERQKAFYASIPQMGLATGLCLSSGMVALLSWLLDNDQFLAWGWRIAFLLSIVLIGVALYVRMHILETPEFRRAEAKGDTRKKNLPIVTAFKNYPGNIALGVGARWIDGVFFNVLAVFSITYLVQQIQTSRTEALTAVMLAALLMCPFILIAGRLADRFGRGRVYGLASLACGISIFPSFWLMQSSGGNMLLIGLAIAIPLSIFYAGVFGPEAALFSDLFPAEVRYTGISIVYQFPGFLVAGIVPGVCTALIQWNDGDPLYICIFVLVAAATSALSAFTIQARHDRAAARTAGSPQE
ncbi:MULTISPECIES: MFS transporter [unclassified Desulfovibrio]|uniref:MFS transporter n=1 Tax=unclassified Desulfovibrio TaxID=2593640 RepID=UPI000F5EFF30|nr:MULTISPECIES: MFS transporter [unclassified Desulfovibrio]RRD69850.1 MFS transporter [Desulfovibrio sp. OH1209_COT-279]RRD86441.1 MFS transporter [Desulfovibrio sp. OH1186_COT-070]